MNTLAVRTRVPNRLLPAVLILLAAGCSHSATSQTTPQPKVPPAPALMLSPLAGQSIPFMPTTYLIATDTLIGLPHDHAEQLVWADSLMLAQLVMRGPEVNWIAPAELRKMAARAPGTITDPDKMGLSLLRGSNVKITPDQLMVKLRPLMAMANARYLMVPAALLFTQTATGVEVTATLLILDSRTGNIIWRSEPKGNGATAATALSAIFPIILP